MALCGIVVSPFGLTAPTDLVD